MSNCWANKCRYFWIVWVLNVQEVLANFHLANRHDFFDTLYEYFVVIFFLIILGTIVWYNQRTDNQGYRAGNFSSDYISSKFFPLDFLKAFLEIFFMIALAHRMEKEIMKGPPPPPPSR